MRAKRKVGRISCESLTAGPAVPLIYAFMKQKYPELETVLEKTKKFDDIESKDIINLAMKENDPLCLKVVEKFTENFGAETGNLALKSLPYGGIYLIGGVTSGLKDYILSNDVFMNSFCDKGRIKNIMKDFPVLLVNPQIEVGILGAEEKGRREMLRLNQLYPNEQVPK